jgi:hypothetical protein
MREELIEEVRNLINSDLSDSEVTTQSLKIVTNLLDVADNHDFSKSGLFVELVSGIDSAYINNVQEKHRELKDLDIEKMAIAGKHRENLNQLDDNLPNSTSSYPLKIADAETMVDRHVKSH